MIFDSLAKKTRAQITVTPIALILIVYCILYLAALLIFLSIRWFYIESDLRNIAASIV